MTRDTARFSEERAEIAIAAAAIGVTATGFAAEAALTAARGTPMAMDAMAQAERFARLQRQRFEARTAVNMYEHHRPLPRRDPVQ